MSLSRATSRRLAAAIVVAGVLTAAVLLATAPSAARPQRALESLFQDDNHLIYSPTPTVASTLDTLRGLGVQRIRATILWRAIAPDPTAAAPPRGFDPVDPASYSAAAWLPYDRLVRMAGSRGIGVDFNVGAPGPRWAMGAGAPNPKYATHWFPSAVQFGRFVTALGRRYSGRYRAPDGTTLPRVSYWSIWNEPNQPGWLAPQWRTSGHAAVTWSPVLYRELVNAAYGALNATGHAPGRDTVLVGELAPEGAESPRHSYGEPLPPMPFMRALYCVDQSYRPLTGAAAAALSCPPRGAPGHFVTTHPGLFGATGFAHHPYSFFLAPDVSMTDPNFVPLSDLVRLERGLDAIFAAYGVRRQLPIYLTEYGYQTDPPNPYTGVRPALQAAYLNQAEHMAWRDPRVRALSQFLLYDAPPDRRYPRGSVRYWATFQTGLLYADGAPKPAWDAYRLSLYVPDPVLGADRTITLWGRVRPARLAGSSRTSVEWAPPGGGYQPVAVLSARGPGGFLDGRIHVPGPGSLRLAWVDPGGRRWVSRSVLLRAS